MGIAKSVRLAAMALALTLTCCEYLPPGILPPPQVSLLVCHGDFGQFANGFTVTRPMELSFIVDWLTPSVTPLNGGAPARILALNTIELSFDVKYEGYRAAYHLNRVDGTFSQRPNLGGVFFGRCDLRPYTTRL
ncbi:MAG TPA: hypothetical protein VM782_13645 [Stellaceae bacterium]|nr:hypothetical protein [Stellaceae bacterium]